MKNYLAEGMDRFIAKQLQEAEESRKTKKKELCEDTSVETNMDRIDKVMDVVAAKHENEKEEAPAPKKERPAKRRRYSGTNMERINKVLGDEEEGSTRIQERQKRDPRGSMTNMDRINKVLGVNEEETIKESEKNKRENKEMTVLESMNKGFEKKYGVPASSRKSLKEYKDVGQDVAEYQKWVDYDMKRYGKISEKTMEKIKSAGLSVTKDQYGQYEVIAKEAVREGRRNCRGRKNRKLTEADDGLHAYYKGREVTSGWVANDGTGWKIVKLYRPGQDNTAETEEDIKAQLDIDNDIRLAQWWVEGPHTSGDANVPFAIDDDAVVDESEYSTIYDFLQSVIKPKALKEKKGLTEAAGGSAADVVYAHLSSDVADFADDELSLREMIDEMVEEEGSARAARTRIIDELLEIGNQFMAEQGFETVEDIDAQIDYLKKLRDAVAAVDKYIR